MVSKDTKLFSAMASLLILHASMAQEENPGLVKMCLFYPIESGHARSDPILNQECPSDHVHTVSSNLMLAYFKIICFLYSSEICSDQFYGPKNFHPATSYTDLLNTPLNDSTSPWQENQSLYWHPSIYRVTGPNGQETYTRVINLESSPYYRWNTQTSPETVAFPPEFRMIAHSDQNGADLGGETGGNLLVECCNLVDGEEECTTTNGNPLTFPTTTCDFLGLAFGKCMKSCKNYTIF